MMRWLVFVTLIGCTPTEQILPDAASDAAPDVYLPCVSFSADQSFAAPIGECCIETKAPLCATGAGICVVDHCVRQCTGHQPECLDGSQEVWREAPDGHLQCTCPG